MKNIAQYGSDYIVDLLKAFDIEYACLNPGSTFRGLHESLVNYGGNHDPEIIECCHEEIAVQIAHGYARATGKPMASIVHDVVGLLHSSIALYYAYLDKVPIVVMGGTGPMDVMKRRPRTDWIHTALVQGNLVRDYVKWDDQPHNIQSVPESLIRAYRTAMTEPRGPVYVCFDVSVQEEPLTRAMPLPEVAKFMPPTPMQADLDSLERAAKRIVEADFPVVLADTLGRNPQAVDELVSLAETCALPVVDLGGRFNFPNTHSLEVTDTDALSKADLVLALDVPNLYGALTRVDSVTREARYVIREDIPIIQIGLTDLGIRGLVLDFYRLQPVELSISGDTSVVLPKLRELCSGFISAQDLSRMRERAEKVRRMHEDARNRSWEEARHIWDARPISTARLAAEVWQVIKSEDWVLTPNTLGGWARRLWNWDKPHRYTGRGWGTATNIGISLGIALAHRGTGRVVVNLQPDGDLLYDSSALWTATHHKIPMLIVMHNNRGYWNDWEHQINISKLRGRSTASAHVGVELNEPAVDFAKLAQSMGCYGEGPIEEPDHINDGLRRALSFVKQNRVPALIDVICQPM